MTIIYLIIINIKNYGWLENFKIIIFEICIIFLKKIKLNNLFYLEGKKQNYNSKFKFKVFDSPYLPCPYYFLYIINNIINKEIGLNKYNLIDFGCGAGRIIKFFKGIFKKFYGIDINPIFAHYYENTDCKFINSDCRKKSLYSFFKKKKNFLFFFQPFDKETILKIINIYKKNSKHVYVVLINYDGRKNLKGFRRIYEKKFNIKSKNILIYKQFIFR